MDRGAWQATVHDEAVELGRAQTLVDLVIHAREAAGSHGVR